MWHSEITETASQRLTQGLLLSPGPVGLLHVAYSMVEYAFISSLHFPDSNNHMYTETTSSLSGVRINQPAVIGWGPNRVEVC